MAICPVIEKEKALVLVCELKKNIISGISSNK